MYDQPKNSLLAFKASPLFEKINFKETLTTDIYRKYLDFSKKYSTSSPEKDALLFYLSNHGFHLLKSKYNDLENLDEDAQKFLKLHVKNTNIISQRLFYYIILISIEETHFMSEQKEHFYNYMAASYSQEFVNFMKTRSLDFSKVNMPIGKFLQGVRAYFDFVKWSPGYGGRPWGNIVGIAHHTSIGRQSFEMMTDYAFTLCHNNGSMFNKGKLYSMYSQFIYDLLDIQASGQIPNWINENLNKNNKYIDKDVLEVFNLLKKIFPEEMIKPLDKEKLSKEAKKRRENHDKLMKQLKSNNNYNNNINYNSGANKNEEVVVKPSKIDNILVNDFKNNKWI